MPDPARPDALDEKAVEAAARAMNPAYDAATHDSTRAAWRARAAEGLAAYLARADLVPKAEVEHIEALWRSAESQARETDEVCDRLRAELDQARVNAACVGEMADRAESDLAACREALVQADEQLCHGNPDTARRIVREAWGRITEEDAERRP